MQHQHSVSTYASVMTASERSVKDLIQILHAKGVCKGTPREGGERPALALCDNYPVNLRIVLNFPTRAT